jgi:O-antigen/teichoic acid export membrane protein
MPLILLKGVIYRILIPLIAEVVHNPITLQTRLERLLPNLNLLFMPATTLGIIFADVLLVPVFGADYSGSIVPVQIVLSDFFISGAGSLIGTTVFAAGNARTFTVGLTLGTIISIVSAILFVPKYGATGAAIGFFVGSQIATFYSLPAFLQLCRPDIMDRTVRVAVPCLIALIAHFLLTKLGNVDTQLSALVATGLIIAGLSATGELSRQRMDALTGMFRPKSA